MLGHFDTTIQYYEKPWVFVQIAHVFVEHVWQLVSQIQEQNKRMKVNDDRCQQVSQRGPLQQAPGSSPAHQVHMFQTGRAPYLKMKGQIGILDVSSRVLEALCSSGGTTFLQPY